MKHTKKNLDYTEKRRGRSLDATGAGPFIQLGVALFALIVVALAVIFLIVPLVRGTIDWNAVLVRRTPAPVVSAAETPAVPALISSRVQTLRLAPEDGEAVLADPAIAGGELLYASGPDEEHLDRIVRVNLETGKRITLTPALANDCLRMPRASGDYLVWFDAKAAGGGSICMQGDRGETTVLVELQSGLPALYLDGSYLVFTAETGLAVKLYAIDLTSMESVTLAVLSDAAYAASAPSVFEGRVYYAAADGVRTAGLTDGALATVETETFVHDPRAAGGGVIWLSGNHDENTDLYYRPAEGETLILAWSVVDAAAADGCALYGRDGTVYAYLFAGETFYMLSGAEEYAQLVTAGGDYALWRVLAESGPVYRYLKVNGNG